MATLKLSPLAPAAFPHMSAVPGVELGAYAAGLRYKNRPDIMMAVLAEGTAAAGVFTRSKAPAAPVDWCRDALAETGGKARVVICNAGNANAFTGEKGAKATRDIASDAAEVIGCAMNEVIIASTGVIGVPLNTAPFRKAMERMKDGLSAGLWKEAASAIMTTDTFAKGASRVAEVDGKPVVISGFTKGSGMIAPDMATMLGFIFTNANISAACLQAILSEVTDRSFNSITVDGDTSTNDCVLAFATGVHANAGTIDDPADPRLADFRAAFEGIAIDLAQQIVKDGEGATKFVTITIEGAEDDAAARKIGLSVANSPLVKTAICGEDANWGRIVAAVGKAGEKADRDKLMIWIGGQLVAHKGAVHPRYSEEETSAHMKGQYIEIKVDVGAIGEGKATVWTCDLTYDYIRINGDYRS